MEEAYQELYQEFLHLRSICLKQAALLHQLIEALKQQRGVAFVPNGDLRAAMSAPILCAEEKQTPHSECCTQAMTRLLPSAGHTKVSTAEDGRATDLLTRATDRLQLNSTQQGEGKGKNTLLAATMGPLASPGLNRGLAPPSGVADNLTPEQQLREVFYKAIGGMNDLDAGDGTTRRRKPPWIFTSFLDSEMLSEGGGLMMSEVHLQSQVCEFCHAIFPGNTTTRGEFLRHLTAHIN
ncbi:hypothetical protein JZ751_018057 [Albula glossodonta]|uniref:Uncharacterized protein n=1 Tax=Albula glossodonta TaxID=121402 RepID=A0A8T2PQ64_9TELE|nr:hypothetical protein JZ751_018057 [Albula glossodonta]